MVSPHKGLTVMDGRPITRPGPGIAQDRRVLQVPLSGGLVHAAGSHPADPRAVAAAHRTAASALHRRRRQRRVPARSLASCVQPLCSGPEAAPVLEPPRTINPGQLAIN